MAQHKLTLTLTFNETEYETLRFLAGIHEHSIAEEAEELLMLNLWYEHDEHLKEITERLEADKALERAYLTGYTD